MERPDILSLQAVRCVGRELQLHLKIRALCSEVERVFNVLVDTGARVNLVKAGLLPPECLTASRRSVRLKVANGQYMHLGFYGQKRHFTQKVTKKNSLDSIGMLFGCSASQIGEVLMKTFSKPSFTHFFQKMAPGGGGGFTRFYQT